MDATLSAAQSKIDRARKHLAELECELDAFLATAPIKFESSHVPSTTGGAFNFSFEAPGVPLSASTIVGDIIHNLRTALDMAAIEIVRSAGKNPNGVYFPFCEKPEDLDRMIKDKNFNRAPPEAIQLLRQLKPYRNGNSALRAIHDLDIQDKHKSLIATAVSAAGPIIQLYDQDGRSDPKIIGDPNSASEIRIVFPDGVEFDGREVIPTLHDLVKLTNCIVEAFRALVNRPGV